MSNMIIPNITDLNTANCRKVAFEKRWPDFYNWLQQSFPAYNLSEQLALYYNNLKEPPVCEICGGSVKFVNFKTGWRKTCSKKCAGQTNSTKEKRKQTCRNKYGADNPFEMKDFQEKSKQTCIKKYGVDNASKSEIIQQRIKETNREKYGCDWVMQNKDILNKSKSTFKEKYGIEWNSQIDEVKDQKKKIFEERYGGMLNGSTILSDRIKQTNLEKYGTENPKQKDLLDIYPDLIEFNGSQWVMSCPHQECNKCQERTYITNGDLHRARMRIGCELCTNLLPVHSQRSTYEIEICNMLDSLGVKYETNVRNILDGQELDIYIPDKKVALEINGCYWHSTEYKSNHYHEQKTSIALSQGIRLYHIWEDWWLTKNEIIKSMIMNWLGISPNKIFARKCDIRLVDRNVGMKFLENNHIQGRSPYEFGYGLYYNDNLVSLMTFGHKRGCVGKSDYKGERGEWELIRFCSALHTNVVGGASKLLKAFIKNHQPDLIYSYASRDISTGQLYNTLGFESDGKITSSYWYIEPTTFKRYHRTSFTKNAIIKRGWKKDKIGWTEAEAMAEQGYYRIYDAGQTKWIYINKKDNII